ncbi:MAG TPA: MBL fold metallo-hydrolase [Longimicrobiaceae bacterium]|nr:MBL fold metallo-hydrolase [Longimicrobiaceae bacterium]
MSEAVVEAAPGVHRISVPLPFPPHEVAAWLIEGEDGFTLVDTGMDTPTARAALRGGAEGVGVTPGKLAHVLLTHVHIDHYGLAGPVRAWSGARVAIHEREEALARRFVDRWPEDREAAAAGFAAMGVPAELAARLLAASDRIHALYAHFEPDDLLAGERGTLPGGGGWEWILTPGHSPGHVVLYHPERRILVAGDHVLPRISPNIGADLYVEDPLSDYLASLRRLRELPVEVVLPSHGPRFGDLRGRVDEILAHHEGRGAEVLALLGEPRTAYEAAHGLFGELPPDNFVHALRETRAHLVHLATEGRAERLPGEPERWRAL